MNSRRWTQVLAVVLVLAFFGCGNRTGSNEDAGDGASEPAASEDASTNSTVSDASVSYQGIDVSHDQGDVDWAAVKAGGITFVFAKATQGHTEVDPKFTENWTGLKNAELVRGAYHFFDPDVDAEAQAEHFIATVQLEQGDLPPVLDIEVTQGVSREGIDDDIKVWLEKVAEAYGITPILYSDRSFIEETLASGFSKYPLWIAEYSQSAPAAPGDWDAWTFWQHSESGQVAGVDGAVDQDIFRGSPATWKQLMVPVTQ